MASRREIHLAGTTSPDTASPTWYTAAWLTLPAEPRRDELQILLHGAGYDHRYWDWPVQPESYSYVAWAAARGAATLNIDRIGSGASSKPAGVENGVAAQAHLLSQIVAAARRGLPGAPAFTRVVLVGHSLGSVVAGYAAATHGDVDAVVLTGYVPADKHVQGRERLIEAGFVPAIEGLAHLRGLVDDDYLAPRRESRERVLYRLEQADPAILAVDEQMMGIATRGELREAGTAGRAILRTAAPTLVLVGQYDAFVLDRRTDSDCFDSLRRSKAASPAHFDFEVVTGTGHNLNLHRNAHESYEIVDRWLEKRAASG